MTNPAAVHTHSRELVLQCLIANAVDVGSLSLGLEQGVVNERGKLCGAVTVTGHGQIRKLLGVR